MALLKSISRLRGGKSLALRSEAGLVFPSGDAAGLRAARPRVRGTEPPPPAPSSAPKTPSSAFSPSGSSLPPHCMSAAPRTGRLGAC